jgi:3',5'-cyclic AMP phosphodiesterase CpdA
VIGDRVISIPIAVLLVVGLVIAIADRGSADRVPASGSTLRGTWRDFDRNGVLGRARRERFVDRTELAPKARVRGRVALLAHITDAHVRDEESPARAPLLDRLGGQLSSTFRPQEALSAQTLAAAVASVDRLHPDAVLESGDLIDNAQSNELDLALQVLRGGRVDPDSGGRGYAGPQQASTPDPFFYRPSVDAPRHAGLLGRAQRPFRSRGLSAPWLPALGNHDLLVQGELAPNPAVERIATGDRLPVAVNQDVLREARGKPLTPATVESALRGGLIERTRRVPADRRRRFVTAAGEIARLRGASAAPGTGAGGRFDYVYDVGRRVRVVVLDLIDRGGGSRGVAAAGQPAWLARQLRGAGGRYVVVMTHQPLPKVPGGERLLRILDADPRVVAAVAGDTHHNRLDPRRAGGHGYWLIQTSSLADFPQQARAIELVRTTRGVAIETWMLDTAQTPLAGISRQLSYLDSQGGRPQRFRGSRQDRNARLYLP